MRDLLLAQSMDDPYFYDSQEDCPNFIWEMENTLAPSYIPSMGRIRT